MARRLSARRVLARVIAVNTTVRPEHDRLLRILVLGVTVTGALAAGISSAAPVGWVLAALLLLPIAFTWSHHARRTNNFSGKVLISVTAILVLVRFVAQVNGIGTLDDTREPLLVLFLQVQVLHAFDLPQRRDLGFSVVASVAVMAVALSAGPSQWIGGVLLAWCVLAFAARVRAGALDRAAWATAGQVGADPAATVAGDHLATLDGIGHREHAVLAGALLVLGLVLFAVLPIRAGDGLGTLAFDFGDAGEVAADAGRIGVLRQGAGGGEAVDYFGFAEAVDPGFVGDLDDAVVMRVRTARPRPLRGLVFDRWDDGIWTRTAEDPPPRNGLPVVLTDGMASLAITDRVTTTISLEKATPNLVFAPADPSQVWVPSQSVDVWDDGTLSTGAQMDAGTVYSVVSDVGVTPAADLRRLGPAGYASLPPAFMARWTQLPEDLSPAVQRIAERVAAGASAPTPHAIAEAVVRHLGSTVRYRLPDEPVPDGVDPVAHLLLTSREGWCEPIATAMVVMLRSQGIPARFVTGFTPGERDLLRGDRVIRGTDAHAWVEVWIPAIGWTTYDPTGATAPSLRPERPGTTSVLAQSIRALRSRLPSTPAGWAGVLLAVVAGVLLPAAGVRWHRARRVRRLPPWDRLRHLLAEAGVTVPPSMTPREVGATARRRLDPGPSDTRPRRGRPDADAVLMAVDTVVAHVEHEVFGGDGPDRAQADSALELLSR